MTAFHVYVEAPIDRTPEGIERLAVAISRKYGLPVPDLIKRMTAGRFRVKANIDAATADAYARALEEVGARVKVEEAQARQPSIPIAAPAPAPKPGPIPAAARTAAPPDAKAPRTKAPTTPGEKPTRSGRYSVSPPQSSSREALPVPRSKTPSSGPRSSGPSRGETLTGPAPAPASGPPREAHERSQLMPPSRVPAPSNALPTSERSRAAPPAFQSGLSAAFSQDIPVASDLGALGGESLSLSSLDGNDASASSAGSFGPPPEPAAERVTRPAGTTAAPNDVPFDLFAPPDAKEAEQEVNLAAEPPAAPPRRRANAPTTPPLGPIPASANLPVPRLQGAAMGGVAVPEVPRSRLAAGVLLAILLGFIPAHLIASRREAKAFKTIDAEIVAAQAAADTPETYATLDSFRDAQLARKDSKRRSIALQSVLIWGLAAAALGYVWFRKIPWDRMPRA